MPTTRMKRRNSGGLQSRVLRQRGDVATLLWDSVAGLRVNPGVGIATKRPPRAGKGPAADHFPTSSGGWPNWSAACTCCSLAPRDSLSVPGLARRAALPSARRWDETDSPSDVCYLLEIIWRIHLYAPANQAEHRQVRLIN